jgi:CheY-like chemotaxis protein
MGPRATQQIRKLGYDGVVLGLTGHALPADILDFTTSGADGVLVKPVSREGMQTALTSYFRSKQGPCF